MGQAQGRDATTQAEAAREAGVDTGKHGAVAARPGNNNDNNPLVDNIDVIRRVVDYCDDGFLFVAGVSKSWRSAWGKRRPRTFTRVPVESPSCLAWARDCGYPWDQRVCTLAAVGGHLDTLKYARAEGCPWDEWMCHMAALGGHVEVLKWCRRNGRPWDTITSAVAAGSGNMELMEWCRANGCPWNADTCGVAASKGHLELLKWCRDRGCAWNKETCTLAAIGGHLEVLRWAKANGCPWDKAAVYVGAKSRGRADVMEWCKAEEAATAEA